MAAATGKSNVVSCHLWGPGKGTSSSRAGDRGAPHRAQREEGRARGWQHSGPLVSLRSLCLLLSGSLVGKGTLGCCSHVSQESGLFASPLRSVWVLPSPPGLSLPLHSLLPLPIPLVPSKARLQMKPSFSPHVFSHCSDASFPAQSFGDSSCPLQLWPFFTLRSSKISKQALEPNQALTYSARKK